MASYIEKYQYNENKPFQVNYQGLLKGVAVKESYWKMGVQRVKSAYEQASGLSLTGNSYKDKLNNFMSSADEQLKKALASDLSSYDNSAKAISIYSPLYKDQEIMANHQRTEEYNKTLGDIENFRKKDGGKYYADANASYAYSGYKEFKEKMDLGESAVDYTSKNRAKEYIPYHDYKKELDDAIKNCPEQKDQYSAMNNSNQAFIDNSTVTFKTVTGLRNCIGSTLSEKARTQMMIEGSVMFKGREKDLAETYLMYHNNETVKANIDKMTMLDLELSKTKDSKVIQYLNNQKSILTNENKEVQEYMDMYAKGDLSFVTGDNFERIATATYSSAKLKEIGEAFAKKQIDLDVSANPIYLQAQKQQHETNMSYLNFKYTSKLNEQKFQQDAQIERIKQEAGSGKSQAEMEKQYREGLVKGELSGIKRNPDGTYTYMTEEEILSQKQTTGIAPSVDEAIGGIVQANTEIDNLNTQQKQLFKNYIAGLDQGSYTEETSAEVMTAHANAVIKGNSSSTKPEDIRKVENAKELLRHLHEIQDKRRQKEHIVNSATKDTKGNNLITIEKFTEKDLSGHEMSNGMYRVKTYAADVGLNLFGLHGSTSFNLTKEQALQFYNHNPVRLANGETISLSATDDASAFDNYININVIDASGQKTERKIEKIMNDFSGSHPVERAQDIWDRNNKQLDKLLGANKTGIQNHMKASTYTNLSGLQKNQVDAGIAEAYGKLGATDKEKYKTIESFREAINFNSDYMSGTVNINFPVKPDITSLKYGNDLIGNTFKMKADGFYNPISLINNDFDQQIKNMIPIITKPNAKNEITLFKGGFIIKGTPIGSSGPTADGNAYQYTIYENDGSGDLNTSKNYSGLKKLSYADMKSRVMQLQQIQ
jgi:hypothetical protein